MASGNLKTKRSTVLLTSRFSVATSSLNQFSINLVKEGLLARSQLPLAEPLMNSTAYLMTLPFPFLSLKTNSFPDPF